MRTQLRTVLIVFLLALPTFTLPAFGADPSLTMQVTSNGYLDARGTEFHPNVVSNSRTTAFTTVRSRIHGMIGDIHLGVDYL